MADNSNILISSLIVTAVIEGITILFRFGFGLQANKHTASTVGHLTKGVRIHHGYVGVFLIVVIIAIRQRVTLLFAPTLVLGIALLASDIIHHFLILWPITGHHEFDWVYSERNKKVISRNSVSSIDKDHKVQTEQHKEYLEKQYDSI